MKATHTNYKHPRHLRVVDNGQVLCMSPSCSDYAHLNKANLPSWTVKDPLLWEEKLPKET